MAFGSKNSTPSFVLTLPIVVGLNEQDLLYKEFRKCGIIYNQLVSVTTKMWHQLRKTRKYRELMAAIAKKLLQTAMNRRHSLSSERRCLKSTAFLRMLFMRWLCPMLSTMQ